VAETLSLYDELVAAATKDLMAADVSGEIDGTGRER